MLLTRTRRRRTGNSDDRFWEDATLEVPRADTPDTAFRERRFAAVRRWVRISVLGLPVVIVVSLLAIMAAWSGDDDIPPGYASSTRATARLALQQWLTSTPEPLPGGWVVGWEAEQVAAARTVDDPAEPVTVVTVHRFSVADGTGSLYTAQVAVTSSPVTGPVVLGEPALLPQPPTARTGTDATPNWGDLPGVPATDAMRTAVQVWGEAFLSGDPAKLRQTVGDPAPGHAYLPMAGTVLDTVTILGAAAAWDDPAGDHNGRQPPTVLARVTLRYSWEAAPTDTSDGRASAGMQFDVLIADADTATPRVVAWGGAGSGQTLTPYGNAITGVEVTSMPAPAPTGTGTPTPGPSGTSTTTPKAEPTPSRSKGGGG